MGSDCLKTTKYSVGYTREIFAS